MSAGAESVPEGALMGVVTVYHFPGILGTLGWGWLHPRWACVRAFWLVSRVRVEFDFVVIGHE